MIKTMAFQKNKKTTDFFDLNQIFMIFLFS